MPDASGGPWLDKAAGRLIRPYTVSDGRTRPTSHFDLMTMVVATEAVYRSELGPDHTTVLDLCRMPATVAEIAAHMQMPAMVVKVLLSDLMDHGAIETRTFDLAPLGLYPDRELLETLRDGLLKRL